jgi:endonuclease YncB( thermonuclease family)
MHCCLGKSCLPAAAKPRETALFLWQGPCVAKAMLTGSSFTLHPAAQTAAGTAVSAPQAASTNTSPAAKHDFTFGDFLDIINPLQHIPVVGTLYRWATGDTIKTPEKIAGDTLYGGPMGALSSVADTLFEQATGKNFGDTVLSLFTGKHDAKPIAVASADQPATAQTPDVKALTQSLQRWGANQDLAARALYAYRRTSSLAVAPY